MKYKLIFISFIVFFLLTSSVLAQESAQEQTQKEFKEIGIVTIDSKEVMLKAEKDVDFVVGRLSEDKTLYYNIFTNEKKSSILLGDKEIKLPSYTMLSFTQISQELLQQIIFINKGGKSSGELSLLKGEENMKIFMSGNAGSFYTQKEDLNLIVKDGVLSLKQNQEIIYKPKGSMFSDFIISPENEISLSEKGFTGTFQIREKEAGAKLGKITGDNVGFFMGEPDDKFDKTQNAIFYNYAKKKVFGDVSYQDYVYDFSLNTNKADVEINLGDINFKQGNGKVSRTIKIGEKNLDLNFNIKNGEVLIPTIGLDKAIKKSEVQKAKHELVIRVGGDKGIILGESGKIEQLNRDSIEGINFFRDNFIKMFDEEQLRYHDKYLISGIEIGYALPMAHLKIEPKKGIEFLNAGFSNPLLIKNLIKDNVLADEVKPYLDIGVKESEIFELWQDKVGIDKIKELKELEINDNFVPIINNKIPKDVLLKYKNIFATSENAKTIKDGDVYASLFYYDISEKDLEEYTTIFPYAYPFQFAKLIKIVPLDIAKKYKENQISNLEEIIALFNYNIIPEDAKKFKISDTHKLLYPGVTPDDIEHYAIVEYDDKYWFDGKDIARLKILGIPPKKANEAFMEGGSLKPEYEKKEKEIISEKMKALNLREDRYNLPFLDLAYKNRMADKIEKPLAVVILNRNDPNSGFAEIDNQLVTLFNSHHLLVYEASTDNEAENVLRQVKEKFGKADLVIIGGHGATNLVNLGKQEDSTYENRYNWREEYSIDESDESLFKALQDISKGKETDVVLLACLSGQGKCPIAKTISDKSGVRVFAPKKETNFKEIIITKDGKLLDMQYIGGFDVTRRFLPSNP